LNAAEKIHRRLREKGCWHVSDTLRQLADLVGGKFCGNGDLVVHAARPIGEASTGDITFIDNEKHAHYLHNCRASAVVVPAALPVAGVNAIQVGDPLGAFVTIVQYLQGKGDAAPHGIDPRACVHPTVQLGETPSIHEFASIGAGSIIGARCRIHAGAVIGKGCRLGDDVTIFPNAVLYDGTLVGHRSIIHACSVIGADGFGYRFQQGKHVKIPQLGYVDIAEDVEIGACTTIDRGTFGPTRIGAGTKIDNLVQVAHNCQIGKHNLLISQMGIAGSSSTGDYVIIAGQAGIVDHVHIGDRAVIGAQAGVTKEVAVGAHMLGAPAVPEREAKRMLMTLEKLPELRRDVQALKQQLRSNDPPQVEKKAG
jgi:UDP-3-O-[3-hydroxymyristoyl] glucosamine N-acyltransferase